MATATRADCLARDAAAPLARLGDAFLLPAGVIYLDGNSLGVLPKATPARVAEVVRREWGEGLIALSELFIECVEPRAAELGLRLATPRDPAARGSQVSYAHADGYAAMQALIARGIVGDFRAGTPGGAASTGTDAGLAVEDADLLRFGFTPLYTRHVDVLDAAEGLIAVLASGEHREPRFRTRAAVT